MRSTGLFFASLWSRPCGVQIGNAAVHAERSFDPNVTALLAARFGQAADFKVADHAPAELSTWPSVLSGHRGGACRFLPGCLKNPFGVRQPEERPVFGTPEAIPPTTWRHGAGVPKSALLQE